MSSPSVSIGLFDPEHGLNVSTRPGAALVFEGSGAEVLAEGPDVEATRKGWRAVLDGVFEVDLEPVADAADLDGVAVSACAVKGRVRGRKVRCLGTVAQTEEPVAWAEIDVLRSLAATFDSDNAFLAVARRPRGAAGHDEESIAAWLLSDGSVAPLEQTRLSTVYDGEGRQRSAGLELWVAGEEYPRRGSGTVVAGTSLALDGVDVHAAAFRWRLEDREGAGAYELWLRREEEQAA